MTQPSIHLPASGQTQQIMGVLLADSAVDVELVSRELGLTDAMSERLRRALDRLECVAGVLQAMGSGVGDDESASAHSEVRLAFERLAAKWPRDYPVGAVEWLVLAG